MNKKYLLLIVFGICLILVSSTGISKVMPISLEQIIINMDKNISGYDDQYMELTMVIYDTNDKVKKYDFKMWQKGTDKRLLRFTSGEMKGMSMLILDRNNVWVYLPAYKRVRRVAAANMKQSIAGSDFTNDDMAASSWAKEWDCKQTKDDEKFWYLACTPKKGVKLSYAAANIVLDKNTFQQDHVDYFNAAGEKIKVYYGKELTTFPGGARRQKIVGMKDPRTKHKTELVSKVSKVNV